MSSLSQRLISWSSQNIRVLLTLISLLFLGICLQEYTRFPINFYPIQFPVVSSSATKNVSSFYNWFISLSNESSSPKSLSRWEATNDDQLPLNWSTGLQKIVADLQSNVDIKLEGAEAYAKIKSNELAYNTICQGNFLTVHTTRERLGNLMFQTASLLGISEKIKRPPVFLQRFDRHSVFASFWIPSFTRNFTEDGMNCSWSTETLNQQKNFMVLNETGAGIYTPALIRTDLGQEGKPILLKGNLQSWRYFHDIKTAVKHLFTFKRNIYDTAIKIIRQKLSLYGLTKSRKVFRPTIVGVHVRRGDFVVNIEGLEPATDFYLLNSLDNFRIRNKQAVFLVASDDLRYCQKVFKANLGKDVFVLKEYPPAVHMAVLSLADYIIISTGTFGWWAAYISDAKSVLYYGDYPRNGSILKPQFPKEDYFPLEWLDGQK